MKKILLSLLLLVFSFGVSNAQFTIDSGEDGTESVAIENLKTSGDFLTAPEFNRIWKLLKNFSVSPLGQLELIENGENGSNFNPIATIPNHVVTKGFVENNLPSNVNFLSNLLISLTDYLNANSNTTSNNFTNSLLTEINNFIENNVNSSTLNSFQENILTSINSYLVGNDNSTTNEYSLNLINKINTYLTNNPTTKLLTDGKFVDGTVATNAIYMDGEVGIGVEDPTAKLHVIGNVIGTAAPTIDTHLINKIWAIVDLPADNTFIENFKNNDYPCIKSVKTIGTYLVIEELF